MAYSIVFFCFPVVEPERQPVGGEVRERHDAQPSVAARAGRQNGENQQRAVRRTGLAP